VNPSIIVAEIQDLWDKGFKEIHLTGQNVDSYLWYGGGLKKIFEMPNAKKATAVDFDQLFEMVAVGFPK
jgi:tRNA-2-methylthio-N6-dimethylallyladenosine synthase